MARARGDRVVSINGVVGLGWLVAYANLSWAMPIVFAVQLR